ncbi:MAG: hypothetical protein KGL74_09440, partial [Elusimicrobia bacterium]|nr:hypothetical protein [Elusimicrobiota bacterium]
DFDARGATDRAVIRRPDGAWSLALMKFTLDEAARSFPGRVKDLGRRGMFSADGGEKTAPPAAWPLSVLNCTTLPTKEPPLLAAGLALPFVVPRAPPTCP